MYSRVARLLLFCLCAGSARVHAQDFKLFDRDVQVHGFISQGYVYTSGNNWLSLNSNGSGSAAYTDMGLNMSSPITDKLHVGAQVYDRNLGQLGQYHPTLDWAYADYRFTSWFGVRGGKVKTVLGLYNDTQDLDFLHTFALLPQSIYPTDLRDVNIAHTGADIYGDIRLKDNLGTLSYTAFVGHRSDSIYDGYPLLLQSQEVFLKSQGGLQYGADLRWENAAERPSDRNLTRQSGHHRHRRVPRSCKPDRTVSPLRVELQNGVDQSVLRSIHQGKIADRFRIPPLFHQLRHHFRQH